jgi:lysozyme family protein
MTPLDAMRRARSLWLRAWPLWSVRMSALGALLTAIAAAAPDMLLQIWNGLPDELRALVPAALARVIPTILFLATLVVRLIPQKPAAERQSVFGSKSGKATAKTAGGLAAITAMIASVIAVEGGWVNHPADPGGETNMGVTKRVAIENGYVGPMRHLPRSVAESIYFDRYLVAPGYAPLVDIDAAVTEELFDTTVNMGPTRPSRWLQAAIGAQCGVAIAVDGKVGPGTIGAYRTCQTRIGAARLCVGTLDVLDAAQLTEYRRLVRVNPKFAVFLKGWTAHRIGNVDRAKCKVKAA